MSYHFYSGEDHECKKCGVMFIPFEQGVPRPGCGAISNVATDFVEEAIEGLMIHKRSYRRYTPHGYIVGSFNEHVFLLLCLAFDATKGAKDFEAALQSHLSMCPWGSQKYLSSHVFDIALPVRENMQARSRNKPAFFSRCRTLFGKVFSAKSCK